MSDESDGRTPPDGSLVVAATVDGPARRPATLDEAFELAEKTLHGLSMYYATALDGPAVKLAEVEKILRELESEIRRLVSSTRESEDETSRS